MAARRRRQPPARMAVAIIGDMNAEMLRFAHGTVGTRVPRRRRIEGLADATGSAEDAIASRCWRIWSSSDMSSVSTSEAEYRAPAPMVIINCLMTALRSGDMHIARWHAFQIG
jgi:hypothetical protein